MIFSESLVHYTKMSSALKQLIYWFMSYDFFLINVYLMHELNIFYLK